MSSPVLAVATTAHLAFAVLRNNRSTAALISPLAVVSVLMGGLPWLMPSAAGVILGLGLDVAWFAACERWAAQPVKPPTPARPVSAAGPTARSAASRPDATAGSRAAKAPAKPRGFVQVPVLAVINETPDIRTFRFARPEGFDFVSGQFLPVRVRADGKDHVRCYSISSSPATRGYLEISVKRQGLVSQMLHTTLRPGSLLFVKAPAGAFIYPIGDDRPLVLVAGGIGITPVLSMLRHAVSAEPTRPVTLLYSAQTEDGFAFRDELHVIERRHPQVRVVLAVTRGQAGADVYPGRIDEGLLRATQIDFAGAVALMCGPQPMIDGLRKTLIELGMPAGQVRSELFEAAAAAMTEREPAAVSTPPVNGTSTHEVRCNGSAVRITAGQSLLEASEAGGFPIDSVCRAGVCGTCRTRVVEGTVECDTTLIDDAERQQGVVLACVSEVRSDCVIEAAE